MLETILNYGPLVLGLLLAGVGWFWRRAVLVKAAADRSGCRKQKTWPTIFLIAGVWCLAEKLLQLAFGTKPAEDFSVSIWAPRMEIGGVTLSSTVVVTWAVMAVLIVLAVLVRLLVIPRMTDKPHGIQNVLELCVESVCRFTRTSVGDLGANLPAYIFTVALFMVGCAAVELLGIRAPTSDITMTFAMALITFLLINYYGIKKKGVGGRIKSMAQPTPGGVPHQSGFRPGGACIPGLPPVRQYAGRYDRHGSAVFQPCGTPQSDSPAFWDSISTCSIR